MISGHCSGFLHSCAFVANGAGVFQSRNHTLCRSATDVEYWMLTQISRTDHRQIIVSDPQKTESSPENSRRFLLPPLDHCCVHLDDCRFPHSHLLFRDQNVQLVIFWVRFDLHDFVQCDFWENFELRNFSRKSRWIDAKLKILKEKKWNWSKLITRRKKKKKKKKKRKRKYFKLS